jgi:hypothetical protein
MLWKLELKLFWINSKWEKKYQFFKRKNNRYTAGELRAAFPGNDDEWNAIFKQKDPQVKKFVQEAKKRRSLRIAKESKEEVQEEEEESQQSNKKVQKALNNLKVHSKNLL